MGFPKDTKKRQWTWDDVKGYPHVRLTNGRMLRIKQGLHLMLELVSKTKVTVLAVEDTKDHAGGRDATVAYLQTYGEYLFAGQNYVDEP